MLDFTLLKVRMLSGDLDHNLTFGASMNTIKEFISNVQEVIELLAKRFM